MTKYSLPWCDWADKPYWCVNIHLIFARPGWREWQSGKPMAEIIPEIDRLRAEIEPCLTGN